MIRRWEKGGGISERYQLHYARAFQVRPGNFGAAPEITAPPADPVGNTAIRAVIIVLVSTCEGSQLEDRAGCPRNTHDR